MMADELHAEIEALHAESMARLNKMAWQCEDLLTLCKELSKEITRQQQTPGDLRAKRARTVLMGAANDTSRRMAIRLILPWYTAELQTALQRMTQEQEKGIEESMDTTKLVEKMSQEKTALTERNNAARQAAAEKRWALLGGSPEGLAKVHPGFFLSMNESEQRRLVAEVEKAE